jgi:hypothetical protein
VQRLDFLSLLEVRSSRTAFSAYRTVGGNLRFTHQDRPACSRLAGAPFTRLAGTGSSVSAIESVPREVQIPGGIRGIQLVTAPALGALVRPLDPRMKNPSPFEC